MMQNQNVFSLVGRPVPVDVPYVMIVESNPLLAQLFQDTLRQEMHLETIFAPTIADALHITQALRPLAFLINSHLEDGDGLTLIDYLHQRSDFEQISTLLLTTNITIYQPEARARHLACLALPSELDDLIAAVENMLFGEKPTKAKPLIP